MGMLKSYVGIVSEQGLELFYPENDHVIPFLMRRAYRPGRANTVCFWSVMRESVACAIQYLLQAGETDQAWSLLQSLATDVGVFSPQENEGEIVFIQ